MGQMVVVLKQLEMCIPQLRRVDLVKHDIHICIFVANYSAQRVASSSILASHKHVAVLLCFPAMMLLSNFSWGTPARQKYHRLQHIFLVYFDIVVRQFTRLCLGGLVTIFSFFLREHYALPKGIFLIPVM